MSSIKETLIEKFDRKEATIGIIGLGYVGLPLLIRYLDEGYRVIGFDIDSDGRPRRRYLYLVLV